MKKNFVWGALGIATATAIGGSYQILAQTTGTSPLESQGSKDLKPLLQDRTLTTRYEEVEIAPNTTVRRPVTMEQFRVQPGSTLLGVPPIAAGLPGGSSWTGPGGPASPPYRANHYETVIIEDGKVKVIFSSEPMDEATRAKSSEARKQLDDAFRTFRSEDSSDQDRAKARTTLSSYLTAQFDHDQEMRRKQIKSLEEQVDKLKKQIAKREESKDKLVELRLTLLENDANGLAFPPAFNQIPGANGPGFNGPGFGPVYGIPSSAYNVQTYNTPNSLPAGVLHPSGVFMPSGGFGQNGQYPAMPSYPVPPNPTVLPNSPAPGPKFLNPQ